MELFDLPPQPAARLDAGTHAAVFGGLPALLSADLHTPDVADLVLQLLDRGWRAGQVATRVEALPAAGDPASAVLALLGELLDETPPDARWREERATRQATQIPLRPDNPASEESRQAWLAEIRSGLGVPRTERREPLRRVKPACALCSAESAFFVTKEVRLCEGCVVLLSTGAVRLPEAG